MLANNLPTALGNRRATNRYAAVWTLLSVNYKVTII